MAVYSVWKDLIKPTIIAYIIACTIPGGIAYILFVLIFRLPRHICRGFKLFRHTNPQYGEGYRYLNSKKMLQGLIEQTLLKYDEANNALLAEWDKFNPSFLDIVLQKQQNRLEQLAERIYHEELNEDAESEIIQNTLSRYDWANEFLYDHWETLPFTERLSIMQKQWNRLQELRNRTQVNYQ